MKRTILFASLFALVGCVQAKNNQIKPISSEQRVPSTIIKRVDEYIKKEKIRRDNETKRKLDKESKKVQNKNNIDKINNKSNAKDVKKHNQVKQTSRSKSTYIDLGVFTVTAYSLAEEDCEKKPNDKYYGITASGYDLKGKSRKTAMTIATDPRVIPLGTKVFLQFNDKKYKKYEAWYTSRDVGGAIKGNRIDLFINSQRECIDFGKVKATVKLIR